MRHLATCTRIGKRLDEQLVCVGRWRLLRRVVHEQRLLSEVRQRGEGTALGLFYFLAVGEVTADKLRLRAGRNGDLTSISKLGVFALFVNDTWSLGRLTLTGGFRYDRYHGVLPEQQQLASTGCPPEYAAQCPVSVPAATFAEKDLYTWNKVAPRIGGAAMRIHPVLLLFNALAFALAFGLLGALVATPAAAVYTAFYSEFYLRRYREADRSEAED